MEFEEPLTHEAFMRHALYDRTEGYYARHALIGRSGDFSTSATLSPAFADAILNWATQTVNRLGLPTPCPLIELGGGDGSLAKTITMNLPDWPLHLVETSEPLRRIQKERLKCSDFRHHNDLKSALRETAGAALIIANEFIDAFPAVKLRWLENDWHEVAIRFTDGEPKEELLTLVRNIDADAPAHPRDQETIYVHPSFHRWLRANIPSLQKGALLFIDYGAERPSRECRAYAGQQRYEALDIYKNAGERDITCDINFTDLSRWCKQLGLRTSVTMTQADFLKNHLTDFATRAEQDTALAFLANPIGAGAAFKVLSAEKN